jgi:hypothetical protein
MLAEYCLWIASRNSGSGYIDSSAGGALDRVPGNFNVCSEHSRLAMA